MNKTVRIGKIEDQDRWRRDDLRACTPDERVAMLLQMQNKYFTGRDRRILRVAHIERVHHE